MKKHYSAMAAVGVIAFAVPFCSQAADLLKADLKPCLHDGTNLGGVNSCGKIWKLKAGQAQLGEDGTLNVQVSGLVLNDESTGKDNGTPDGVDAVAAVAICDGAV